MTATPSNPVQICQPIQAPARQDAPWSGELSADLRKGALSVCAAGLTLIDARGVCWGIVFPDKTGSYNHVPLIVEAVNSHATLKARVEELEAALREITDAAPYETSGGGHRCRHCGYRTDAGEPERHNSICSYAKARAALEAKP